MPPLRPISFSPDENTVFSLHETAVKLAPGPTIVGALVSVNLEEVSRGHGVGCADRKVTCDRDGLGEM